MIDLPLRPSPKPVTFSVQKLLNQYKSNCTLPDYESLFQSIDTNRSDSFLQPEIHSRPISQKESCSATETQASSTKQSQHKINPNDIFLQLNHAKSAFKYLKGQVDIRKDIEKSAHFVENHQISNITRKISQQSTNTQRQDRSKSKENVKQQSQNKYTPQSPHFQKAKTQIRGEYIPSRSITPRKQISSISPIRTKENSNLNQQIQQRKQQPSTGATYIKLDFTKQAQKRVLNSIGINFLQIDTNKSVNIKVELSLKSLLENN